MYKLYTAPGSGGMITEACFAIAGIPVEIQSVAWDDVGWQSKALASINPLGQLPTLVLPDGRIMTETAAIVLHLNDVNPGCGLVPPADHPNRPEFLRWLVFIVSAIYPTFTYGDMPERWVEGDADAAKLLRTGTDEHRKVLLRYLESFCGEPWFLGETFSCLDVYFWMIRHWRPGLAWFAAECPRLDGIGERAGELPTLSAVSTRNFPDKAKK